MVKVHKEKWRGQEAISKLGILSIIILEIFIVPIMELFSSTLTGGVFLLFGIAFYFLTLLYISKSYETKITRQFGGIRRWKVRYDLGRGRTGNTQLFIADMYPLKKAPKVLQEQVAKAEGISFDVETKVKGKEELNIDALSLFEDTQREKEKAMEVLRNRDMIEKIQKEYLLDRILQPYYEQETEQEAFIKGKPTKAFLEWKESDGKVVKIIQETVRTQIEDLKSDQSQKDIAERRISLIAEEVALTATLGEIISADAGEPEGGAVHGFLKRQYEDYDDLIKKHQILDLAQEISKEIWIPKITKVIEHVHLKDCVKTVVELYEVAVFDHEPHLPYKRMVVYAQEPLEDAVDWKERVPKTIHYFPDIPVTNGYSNVIIPTRITFDNPLVFIAHSPGKDYFVRNLTFDEDEINDEKKKNTADEIADLEAQMIETNEKAKKYEKSEEAFRKIATEYADKMDIMNKFYAKEKIKTLDQRPSYQKTNWGKILLYGALIIGIIFVAFLVIGVGTNIVQMTNSTSSNGINSFSLYGKGIFSLGG